MSKRRKKHAPRKRFPNTQPVPLSGGIVKWRARIRLNGTLVRGPTRDTEREAAEDALRLRDEHRAAPSRVVTLSDALETLRVESRQRMIAESTRKTLAVNSAVLLEAWHDATPVLSITADEINQFVRWARTAREPKPFSANTVREKLLPLLRRLFERAKVRYPTGVRPPRARRRTMAYFTPEEIHKVLRKMRGSGFPTAGWHADIVELLALTGIRAGELCRLTRGDLDLQRGIVSVVDAKAGGGRREVPVHADHFPVLERLRARAEQEHRERHPERWRDDPPPGKDAADWIDDAPVVPGGQDYLRLMLRRWRERLKEPRLNGRALRHSLGTALHALGVPMPDAMAWMGHSTTSSHIRYLHAAQSRQRDAAERLSSLLRTPPPPGAHGQESPDPDRSEAES